MQKVSAEALQEIRNALDEYQKLVDDGPLADGAKYSYKRFANDFVRWLGGYFEPGATIENVDPPDTTAS